MNSGANKIMGAAGAPRWMVTFADLMALLFALFVLLLSFSDIDSESFKKNAGPINEAFNAKPTALPEGPPSPTASLRLDLEAPPEEGGPEQSPTQTKASLLSQLRLALAEEIARKQVELVITDNLVVIRFPSNFTFTSGAEGLTDAILPTIDSISRVLARTPGKILIAGHTDDTPISTARFRSNWDLSSARAVSVVHRLLANKRIDPTRVTTQGFAEHRPLASNETPEKRAKNRRVEISVEVPVAE